MKKNVKSIETELQERVKELACLFEISELSQEDHLSLDEILNRIVQIIPKAWQYPEYTVARISLDSLQAKNIGDANFVLTEKIIINGQCKGLIEIFYTKEMPPADEGPFLAEERKLIKAISRKLAFIIERKANLVEKENLYEQIRHADRLATIGELTAGIAHEINEPLGSILGFAQLAIKDPDLPSQVGKDLEKIIKASLNAREIIKKLMYFSHQMPQRFEEVEMVNIIKDSMYFLETRCSRENIKVVYKLAPSLPALKADAIQLNQVIVNLVVNAIQAMPGGGQLTISTHAKSANIILCVEDTGIGIKDEIKPHIFKPFFTTKDVNKGTGLGLSVVHGIITSHKGQINVESKENIGTKFEIILPAINH